MRRQNDTGMTLAAQEKPGGRAETAALNALPAAAVLLGVFGTLGASWHWQNEAGAWIGLCVGLLVLAGYSWLLLRDGRAVIAMAGIAAAAALFCVVFAAPVRSAAAQLVNDVLAFLETKTGRIYLRHERAQEAGVSWALAPAAALFGALLAAAAAYAPGAGLVLTAAVWIGCMTGVLQSSVWLLVLTAGGVWMLAGRRAGRDKALLQATLAVGLLTALSALALGLSGAGQSWDTTALHRQAEKTVHRLCYESEAQTMPEGDFSLAGDIQFSQQPMLQVTMSRPESVYLRGFVGQRYTADGWAETETEALAEEAQTFYWLHKTPFFAQSQLSTLAGCLDFETQPLDMTVTPTGACREDLYAPYEIQSGADALDPLQNGDGAQRLNGQKYVSFSADGNLVSHAYELLDALQERLDAPELKDYLEAEGNYRTYVYDTYLRIPEQTAKTLTEFLGQAPVQITSYEAKQRILGCLDETVSYAQNVPQLPEGKDFTSYFLKELGEGNAVHYATAAVMMMRYFGIPARYAEGYLITPDAVAEQSGEVTLTLRGTDAHAWCEYYEDGVGWIPFEVTPPYRGVMAESSWLWYEQSSDASLESSQAENGQLGGQGQSTRPQAQVEKPEQTQQEQQREQNAQSQKSPQARRRSLLLWLAVILLLLAAAIAFLILRRRSQLEKRRQAFEQENSDSAAMALFAHGMRMMWASGLARENCTVPAMDAAVGVWGTDAAQFEQIAAIHSLARYSSHAITQEQRELVRQFEERTKESFIGKLKWYQKLYQKWIRCMY